MLNSRIYYAGKKKDPQEYLAERWEMKPDKHPGRDGLTFMLLAISLISIAVLLFIVITHS